jgi:hypothetical protein
MHNFYISMARLPHAEINVCIIPCKVMPIRAYVLIFAVNVAFGVL